MKNSIKKYINVRNAYLKAGMSVPKEITNKLRGTDMLPPQNLLNKMIKETRSLINEGSSFWVSLPQFGIMTKCRLYWEEDNHPCLEWEEVKPLNKKLTPLESLLLKEFDIFEVICDSTVMYDHITTTPDWKEFQNRITAVCEQSDQWEKQYPDFDWHDQVLSVAEG